MKRGFVPDKKSEKLDVEDLSGMSEFCRKFLRRRDEEKRHPGAKPFNKTVLDGLHQEGLTEREQKKSSYVCCVVIRFQSRIEILLLFE